VYRTIRSQDDSCQLQNDIYSLLKWAETWQMRFNSKKCHIISISRQRHKSSPVYYLGTDVLSTVSSHTYLGITVSSDLKWHEHILNICLKATRTLNFVRSNTYCCFQEAKNLAYLSLVHPNLEYTAAAWDPYTAKDIQQLERVQRRAACFVKKDYRHTTSVTGLLGELGWLPLSERLKHSCLTVFYKAFHNLSAISLDHLSVSLRHTRASNENKFMSLPVRTDAFKYSFFPRTITDRNSLPLAVRPSQSFQSFHGVLLSSASSYHC